MLVIMMSPSIPDTRLKMTKTCEEKEEKKKNQQTKDKTKKYLENPELDELRVKSPHASNCNAKSCCFSGVRQRNKNYDIKHLLPRLRLRLQKRHSTNYWLTIGFATRRKFE